MARPNTMRGWTTDEIATLRKLAPLGREAVAEALGRPTGSIRSMASKLGISLRRSGSRRGLIMGQPRGVSLPPDLREPVLVGAHDDERARRIAYDLETPLCPACGSRPAHHRESGLCDPCRLRRLAEAHRYEADTRIARRELDAARQRKHRAEDRATLR